MVGCFRRDQLWQKLQQEVAVSLTHHEFLELISLVGTFHHQVNQQIPRLFHVCG